MPKLLYLDTARLGKMSPGAQRAHIDFLRFAGDYGGSMYFDRLLHDGLSANCCFQRRFHALRDWRGMDDLRIRLRRSVGASPDSHVLLANRSSLLMKLAARLLFGPCRNVLTTDLTWPSYAKILKRNRGPTTNRITSVRLRRRILLQGINAAEVVTSVLDAYQQNQCDGLFLPAVDNLGVRFPVGACVQAISKACRVRFVVVDAAQAVAHVPLNLSSGYCDFLLAGCHKWMRAFHPMGLGFFGRQASAAYIEETVARLLRSRQIDDPLLRYTEETRSRSASRYGETVNVGSMFSCYGALTDAPADADDGRCQLRQRIANAEPMIDIATRFGWKAVRTDTSMRSGILVLRSPNWRQGRSTSQQLRRRFLSAGIALTTYDAGLVRVSLPQIAWTSVEMDRLRRAFAST